MGIPHKAIKKNNSLNQVLYNFHKWALAHRFSLFLVALISLNFLAPFMWNIKSAQWLTYLIGSIVLLCIVSSTKIIRRHPAILYILIFNASAAIFLQWIEYSSTITIIAMIFYMLLVLPVTIILLIEIFIEKQKMTSNILFGAICLYWLIGLVFAKAFIILQLIQPGSLLGVSGTSNAPLNLYDFYYFSYTTLTTIGYGEILAVSIPGKVLVIIEGFCGLFYMAITIARFIFITIQGQPDKSDQLIKRKRYLELHKKFEYCYILYFVIIIALMLLSSFTETSRPLKWLIFLIGSGATLSISYIIFFAKRYKLLFYFLVLLAFSGCMIGLLGESNATELIAYGLQLIFLTVIVLLLFYSLLLEQKFITRDYFLGSIFLFWLLGLQFGLLYAIMQGIAPSSFSLTSITAEHAYLSWNDFFYFSYMTLTTIGYGDIVPATAQAKSFVVFEGILGVFYVAILVARLVLLYAIQHSNSQKKRS